MKIYQISTGCYSDFDHKILAHEKEYTAKEFSDLCETIAKEVVRKDRYGENVEAVVTQLTAKYGFFKPKIAECHFWDYSYNYSSKSQFAYYEVNE